jgi:hypothetical protein
MKTRVKILTSLLITILLVTACSTNKKNTGSKMKLKADEILIFENNVITDPVLNCEWKYFENNPTTFYRVKLNYSNILPGLPAREAVMDFLTKVSYQIDDKRHHGNIGDSQWFNSDCDFLTSSSERTKEGEILYEAVHWDSGSRLISKIMVTGGDLIVILLMHKK